jgi:hypothetical protein
MRVCRCEVCGNDFEAPNQVGRKPRWCDRCRAQPDPVTGKPRQPVAAVRTGRICLGCDGPVAVERPAIARYCTKDCQIQSNAVHFRTLAKQRRAARKRGRLCAVCSADISERNGNSKYCGGACWRAANFLPVDMSDATCLYCSASLCSRKGGTDYCDWRCRYQDQFVPRERVRHQKVCDWCAQEFEALNRMARFCSHRCNQRAAADADRAAYRAKKREENYVRRARLAGAQTFLVTDRDWRRLLERYQHRCAYCLVPSDTLTRDHIVPLARGGSHGVGNLLPVCARCNGSKNALFLTEWRAGRRFGSPKFPKRNGPPAHRQLSIVMAPQAT